METIDLPVSEPTLLPAKSTAIEDFFPIPRDLIEIAAFSILLRAALFLVVFSRLHYSFNQWPTRVCDDGASYVAYARAFLGDASQMTPYDQRVFPGYPAMIALVHKLGVPFNATAVGLDWTSAGVVAALSALLFRDRRVGWALTCLPLQYVINSSLMMSEGPMLALVVGGLLLSQRGKSARGGLLLGLAGLVRPMACFAVIGEIFRNIFQAISQHRSSPTALPRRDRFRTSMVTLASRPCGWISKARNLQIRCSESLRRRHGRDARVTNNVPKTNPPARSSIVAGCGSSRFSPDDEPVSERQSTKRINLRHIRSAVGTAIVSGTIVLIGIVALHHWTGDAFRGAKVYANGPSTYNGHLVQWPFQSLLYESLRPEVPRARVFYIWIHVAITLAALTLVTLRCFRDGRKTDSRDLLAAPWLAGNTLFVLCIGSYWGFEHFPRFSIPALPALFWALRRFLPRGRLPWIGIAAIIFVAASFVVLQNFVVPD